MSIDRISRERLEAPPGAVYTETILEPGYNFMLDHYFYPLVETNKAWTVMLLETGIIGEDSAGALLDAILTLEAEGPEGMGRFEPRYEYFYSHMEHYLIGKAGEEVAGEINIGRTRPEPLVRMVTRERILGALEELTALCKTLLEIAEREAETVMPQWTHFQHAQLSTVGHYLVGIVESLGRDSERLFAAYSTTNRCTLGCGALAGSSYPLDRQLVADLLGFDGFVENTIDCVSSSMMPQKKNAYPFEYVRARAARAVGDMASAFGTLHNTNFQDIKDVEEEVVYPVFRSFDETSLSLRLLEGTISSMEIKRDNMLEKAAGGFGSCTELAARIHRQTDLSYRTAHRIVGNLVLRAYKQGKHAADVDAALVNESAREVTGHDLDITDDTVRTALDPTAFVEAHVVPGGPAPQVVRCAIQDARARLEEHSSRISHAREGLSRARGELDARVKRLTTAS